jgi:AcrR family transcriptional regulator
MSANERKRHDPRRDATRTALIEAAESLIATAGVDGVSTRQIGAAIGSLNTNVVAYHFGSKEALIEAIYRHRLPGIDQRRGELLDAALHNGTAGDLIALMRVFALPLFEQTDSNGCHSFARFLAGVERAGMIATRGALRSEFPETDRLVAHMLALLPATNIAAIQGRLRIVVSMIQRALQLIDQDYGNRPDEAQATFEDTVTMAAAAVGAPQPNSQESM